MKTKTQPPAAGEAEHTPTPYTADTCPDALGYISIRRADGTPHGDTHEPLIATAYLPEDAAFIVRACNAHTPLSRAWSELAYHANALANAKTKAERDAAALKVFTAIGDAKDALPELRTLSESRAALQSARNA